MVSAAITLLGPQRREPTLRLAVESAGVGGRLAAVTAGWEEREEEDQELSDHLGGRIVNLHLWARAEEVYRRDPELLAAVRDRREELRRLQELYRIRLGHALDAARALLARPQEDALVGAQAEAAIEDVRRLDAEHLDGLRAAQARFVERWNPWDRPAVERQREQLRGILEGVEGLCVAGGDLRILLGRMRLFGLLDLWDRRPIFAWSAGAMVLGVRIVLFHDSPPQGAGDAEVFEVGFGRVEGVLPLPHARHRLRLDDRTRVALFARRFVPDACLALDYGSGARWDGGTWRALPRAERLGTDGVVVGFGTR